MDLLETIIEMQKKGIPESQIVQTLKNNKVPLAKINEALNQAKIKDAVFDAEKDINQDLGDQSIMQSNEEVYSEPQMPYPQYEEQRQESQMQTQGYYQDQTSQQYPPYYQETQNYYEPQSNLSTETIAEIAEQVVQEKFIEFNKKVGDLPSFKNSIQEKIKDLDDRLKRIENNIDKIQNAIIGKIGEFGENTSLIHQDLDNLHNTMSKLMNPLIDNLNELRKIAQK